MNKRNFSAPRSKFSFTYNMNNRFANNIRSENYYVVARSWLAATFRPMLIARSSEPFNQTSDTLRPVAFNRETQPHLAFNSLRIKYYIFYCDDYTVNTIRINSWFRPAEICRSAVLPLRIYDEWLRTIIPYHELIRSPRSYLAGASTTGSNGRRDRGRRL